MTESFEVVAGWLLPRTDTIPLDGGGQYPYDGEMDIEFVDGVYECRRLELRRMDGGPPVTAEGLRDYPIKDILRTWIQQAGFHFGAKEWRSIKKRPELEQVAIVYQYASFIGDPPTQAVADFLGISRTYASRKVMKARSPEVGLLPPVSKGE